MLAEIEASGELLAAITEHASWIAGEALAVTFVIGPIDGDALTLGVDTHTVRVRLARR